MNERHKIAETRHFLQRMKEAADDHKTFQHELSAFLSASRSALQYALEEAQTKVNGQKWYDSFVSSSAIVRFFKDARDKNIHAEPVKPRKHVDISIKETIRVSATIMRGGWKNDEIKTEHSLYGLSGDPNSPSDHTST